MHQYPDLEPVWRVLAEPARPLPPDADRFLEAQVGPDGSPKTLLTYMTALRTFWAHRLTLAQPERYGADTLTTFVLSGLVTATT